MKAKCATVDIRFKDLEEIQDCYQAKDNTMNDKKTIIKPRGAFPDTMQGWADYEAQWDFSPDEIYANRPPTWNGEDDEPEEEWRVGEDFGEDE